MEITNKWNFPNNGGGQIRGISDAGIETFTGNEIQSLAREICQNSLDALDNSESSCVHVEFERYLVNKFDIPGYSDYSEKIKKAHTYWSTRSSEKANVYLNKALMAINKDTSFVLRISDYNTTGLLDPYGDSDNGWNSLIKIDGGATKNGDKAGAFGIGKNAPFCNSDYRMVFYRTLNTDGEIAAQGVSRFISFPEDLNDTRNTMTYGIGYYGNANGNLPVKCIPELDNIKKREQIGTDVFVFGFNASMSWDKDVICEILENFLMSIFREQLSVSINTTFSTTLINNKTLPRLIEKYQNVLKQSWDYYRVLISKDTKVFKMDFHGLGTLKLSILVDSVDKLNRKILITRTSGMKLFAIGNISRIISFSGILEMEGKKLNEYFREMETPAHDKWVPERYSKDPKQAKQYYDELKQWLRDTVLSLGEYSSEEEIEVEGLSGVLQKESPYSSHKGDDNKEKLTDKIDNILVQPRVLSAQNSKGLFYGNDGIGKSNDKKTPGKIGSDGLPTTRKLGGTRQRRKKEPHKGKPYSNGRDTVHDKQGGDINQPLKNVRIIKLQKDLYKVSFVVPKSINNGHVEIVTVGENGSFNRLKIKSAKGLQNCNNIGISSLGIYFSDMLGNEKATIEFSLVDERDYAMEVNVYEHN